MLGFTQLTSGVNNNIIYQYNNHIAPRHCEKIFDFRGNPVLMEIENGKWNFENYLIINHTKKRMTKKSSSKT